MPSSGMLCRVAHVRTDVSEERIASMIRVTRIGKLGRLAVTSVLRLLVTANVVRSLRILVTLMVEAIRSSVTSVLTRATQRSIAEDDILNSIFMSAASFRTSTGAHQASVPLDIGL
jgi:hypothetical protein